MSIISESTTRIKTAAVLLAVIALIGFMDNQVLTWLFLGLVYIVAFKESVSLFVSKKKYMFVYASLLWIGVYFYPHPSDLISIALVLFASHLAYTRDVPLQGFLALLYPTIGMMYLYMLYAEYQMGSLVWILSIVALTDVGAYFVGKKLGKTKFCNTSPNKTIEGVAGGVVLATVLGTIVGITIVYVPLWSAILISFLVSASSIFGDLFESYLKREAKVKDSGDILPGHGGVLDRIDGYLFASVVMYVLLRAFGY